MANQRLLEESPPDRVVPSLSSAGWIPLWALIRLIRPEQWVKNGLVFAALLYSGELRAATSVGLATLAFVSFCLASSAAYCLNDALDAREDRVHPKKRLRPVAAGLVSPALAKTLAVFLAGGAILLGFAVRAGLGLIVLVYLSISLLYSFRLKHAVLLDILAIASGFVLRAAGVAVPLLSLFLAVAKRRHELLLIADAPNHRPVLGQYSTQLLDQMLAALSATVLMAYFLYAKDTAKPQLFMLTSPMVVYGVFRYLYLVYRHSAGGDPEELLLTDAPLLVTVGLWTVVTAAIIYLL